MAFCSNCGANVQNGAKFCVSCGAPISPANNNTINNRQQEFAGKIIKCPHCGETVSSFTAFCPMCGFEFRDVRPSSAVQEFAHKLEILEANREPDRRKGLFDKSYLTEISKTDGQKISLIQAFAVPNTKEDVLEFMILASSNVNPDSLDPYNQSMGKVTKSEKALAEAWYSKMNQVYEKAKQLYGSEDDFSNIQSLYDKYAERINKNRKKAPLKSFVVLGGAILSPFIIAIIIFGFLFIYSPMANKKEDERLDSIYQESIEALDNNEYKKALAYAEGLVFDSGFNDKESRNLRWEWDTKRELLFDDIIDKAEEAGIHLERPIIQEEEENSQGESSNNPQN